jgi:hypothetical protein
MRVTVDVALPPRIVVQTGPRSFQAATFYDEPLVWRSSSPGFVSNNGERCIVYRAESKTYRTAEEAALSDWTALSSTGTGQDK